MVKIPRTRFFRLLEFSQRSSNTGLPRHTILTLISTQWSELTHIGTLLVEVDDSRQSEVGDLEDQPVCHEHVARRQVAVNYLRYDTTH